MQVQASGLVQLLVDGSLELLLLVDLMIEQSVGCVAALGSMIVLVFEAAAAMDSKLVMMKVMEMKAGNGPKEGAGEVNLAVFALPQFRIQLP